MLASNVTVYQLVIVGCAHFGALSSSTLRPSALSWAPFSRTFRAPQCRYASSGGAQARNRRLLAWVCRGFTCQAWLIYSVCTTRGSSERALLGMSAQVLGSRRDSLSHLWRSACSPETSHAHRHDRMSLLLAPHFNHMSVCALESGRARVFKPLAILAQSRSTLAWRALTCAHVSCTLERVHDFARFSTLGAHLAPQHGHHVLDLPGACSQESV